MTSLSAKLSNENETKSIQESDYLIYLSQLNQLVEKANITLDTKKKKLTTETTNPNNESKQTRQAISFNIYRLVSKIIYWFYIKFHLKFMIWVINWLIIWLLMIKVNFLL